MEFNCNRDDFIQAINSVQKAVCPKSPVALLEGIYLKAYDNWVLLYCTDKEIGIEYRMEAEVLEEGALVVNAKLFGEVVRNLPEETVNLTSISEEKIKIVSGDSFFVLYIISPDAFPTFPEIERKNEYCIDQFELKRMFQQTSFAISADNIRKTLTGLLLEGENKDLTLVAVDGFRVALRKIRTEKESGGVHFIIPGRTINELIKVIPSNIGEICLYGNENVAILEFSNCRVFTRVIDGEFFNYKYIVPEEYITRIVVRRKQLLEAVERASLLLSADQVMKNPVIFIINDENIVIKASSEQGDVEEEIRIEMEGSDMRVGFNPKYYIDALRAIEEDMIEIKFTTTVGQCVIVPVKGDHYTYLILPVKMGN